MQPIILAKPRFLPAWPWLRPILRVLLFPWFFWWAIGRAVDWIRIKLKLFGPKALVGFRIIQLVLFLTLAMPVIVLMTGELLIYANEAIVGEEAKYKIKDKEVWWQAGADLRLPGPPTPSVTPVDPRNQEAYHQYLVEKYAPVLIQKIGYTPTWDIPVRIDFDGNNDPRDNRKNAEHHGPLDAVVYGELTAETKDSFYLLYCVYHIRDYDHPVRQLLATSTFHDSDNEGFMIRVDKSSMKVVQGEGWFHNRFFLADLGGESDGSEPVQGQIYLEGDTHPLIYVQSMGHGVRFAQPFDLNDLERNVKVIRWRGDRAPVRPEANHRLQFDATYDFTNFDLWYSFANGPFSVRKYGRGMFEERLRLGVDEEKNPIYIGRFISGLDYDKKLWSRPKPPWSWDDGWDRVPIAVWHFYPSLAFQSHFGNSLSSDYLFNRPVTKIFGAEPNAFLKRLKVKGDRRPGAKWGGTIKSKQKPLRRDQYTKAVSLLFKKYINRLFRSLG